MTIYSYQTVREEYGADAVFEHLVNVSDKQACFGQVFKNHPIGEQMHVDPINAGLHCTDDRPIGPENGLVDHSLLIGEFAIRRKGARDVAAIAVVLGAHVKQTSNNKPKSGLVCVIFTTNAFGTVT